MASGAYQFDQEPVSVREFLESPQFMNATGTLYPKVLDAIEEMNSGRYQEAVLTGGIGVAKSTIALYSQAYQLYVLSCYHDPHVAFELDPASEIVIVFQNINRSLAKAVEFERFKAMIATSPYFSTCFAPDSRYESELRFPHRVVVKAVTGLESGAIGQNVIGGIIDEVNFMHVVQRSQRSNDGGVYDQALALYTSIARRRKSRFLIGGTLPGILCLVSSKRYPGEFTDRKIEEAQREIRTTGTTSIYIYDRRLWDIKPQGIYSEARFRVFAGDLARKPRILEEGEEVSPSDVGLVHRIPVEFKPEFERDLLNRDFPLA